MYCILHFYIVSATAFCQLKINEYCIVLYPKLNVTPAFSEMNVG